MKTMLQPEKLPILLTGISYVVMSFYNGPGPDLVLLPIFWSLLILAFWMQAVFQNGLYISRDPLSITLLLYLCILLINPHFSQMKMNSFFIAWTLAPLPIIYLLWINNKNHLKAWVFLREILFSIGIISALFGIFGESINQPNVNAQFLDSNIFATLLYCVLIPSITRYLLLGNHFWLRRYYETGLYLMLYALVLTNSRAAMLIFGALLCFQAIAFIRFKIIPGKALFRLLLILLAVVMTSQLTNSITKNKNKFLDLADETSDTWTSRLLLWSSSIDMYMESPVTGSGIGSYSALYPKFRSPQETYTTGKMAHNDYLQFLLEGGPLMATILLFLFFITSTYCIRLFLYKPGKDKPANEILSTFSLATVLLGLHVHALANFPFQLSIIGAIYSLYLAKISHFIKPVHSVLAPKPIKYLVFSSAFLAWGLLVYDKVIYSVLLPGGQQENTRDSMANYKFASLATIIRPNNIVSRLTIIDQLRSMHHQTNDPVTKTTIENNIHKEYALLFESCTSCGIFYREYGVFLKSQGKLVKSEKMLRVALEKNPTIIFNYIELAKLLSETDRYPEGMALLLNDAPKWTVISSNITGRPALDELNDAINSLVNKYGNKPGKNAN